MPVGQIANRRQIGDVAIHRKHAVGGDQFEASAGRGRFVQLRFEIGHVVVAIAKSLGFAEPDAVDDAGVIQLVGDDCVLGSEKRFEQSAVGVEARAIEDRVFRAEKLAELRFQLLVRRLGAADEPHRGQAVAPAIERRMGSLNDLGMLGQPEIIVGAHVEHFASLADADMRILRRRDHALALIRARGADAVELLREMSAEGVVHGGVAVSEIQNPKSKIQNPYASALCSVTASQSQAAWPRKTLSSAPAVRL